MTWMAWTLPSALFFVGIAAALLTLTVIEHWWPTVERAGVLGFATTRGDRFFMGLLASAFIHLTWLAMTDFTIWIASLISLATMVALLRWG